MVAVRYLAILCVTFLCLETAMAQSNGPTINQGPGSALSFGQQGGITAGTVNIGPQRRTLSDPAFEKMRTQLLEMPRDKKIFLMATTGDTETIEFRDQILQFMKSNGFPIADDTVGYSVWNRPFRGVNRQDKSDGTIELQIGPP